MLKLPLALMMLRLATTDAEDKCWGLDEMFDGMLVAGCCVLLCVWPRISCTTGGALDRVIMVETTEQTSSNRRVQGDDGDPSRGGMVAV